MLFLAVFCGFLAENLREHQVEHKRTVRYAKQFINEIELDTAMINTGSNFVDNKKMEVDSLISAIDDKDWKRIYFWGVEVDVYYLAKFHSAGFEQIKYSGYLRNFKNEKLVALIQDYINFRDNVEIVQNSLTDYYDHVLSPFLNSNLNRRYLISNSRSIPSLVNAENRRGFDSLWSVHPMPKKLLGNSEAGLTEFVNLLIGIRNSYSLGFLYGHLINKSRTLISELKKEFNIK